MFELPQLPYDYDALEPHFDETTMKIHHAKHHQAYVDGLNQAVKDTELADQTLEDLLTNVSSAPVAVRNHGGGHYNHSLFWKVLSPQGGGQPSGGLAEHLESEFGSFDEFKKEFTQVALGRFGSGWAWLVVNDGELRVGSTPNQDSPLMDSVDFSGTPILGVDVWEHAYYLHYQNRRADYVEAFWKVVNWSEVEQRYAKLTQ